MKETEKKLTTLDSAQTRDGIDAEKTAEVSTSQTGEKNTPDAGGMRDKDKEFDALISGEYKEQFSQRIEKILKGRLREVKGMKETAEKNAQFLASLMEKFNITDGDTQKLQQMIDAGMSKSESNDKKEALMKRLIAENSYLRKNHRDERRRAELDSRIKLWEDQAKETKEAYADFDFKKELSNPEFKRLLKLGVSVKNAYEVTNLSRILEDNSKNAEKKVISSIRSKGNRPVENGSDLSGGILLSGNISRLTKKQRADLAKRAAKGETIEF